MNQRYRNDDDFGRGIDGDNTQRRYAQPSADRRFERDRGGQRGQSWQNRGDDNDEFDNQRWGSSGSSGYGSSGGGSSGAGSWSERTQESPWQNRQREENPFDRGFESRSQGSWGQGNSSGSSGGYSSSRGFASGERGFGTSSARDYSGQQGYGQQSYGQRDDAFGGRQRFGARAYEAGGDNQWGERSFGGRGSYLDSSSQARRGAHFGKGPKGYQRSDERIREEVCDRLAQDDELDASEITVSVSDREVTLEGSVPDRYSKHRAEDIVDSVSGVNDIHNRLKVDKGILQELGDKVMGREANHSGNAGTRPTENKNPTESRNGLAAR